jgi:hypothetical protein
MELAYAESLAQLRGVFETEEDWVSVGHVEYLLDRLAELKESADWSGTLIPVSRTVH